MRIIGGTFKGRRLSGPSQGRQIRPTSDKVRQAVFNMLESQDLVAGARVLDAFCGTGALGLEALSRGASYAEFWDVNATPLKTARENACMLDIEKSCRFIRRDADRPLSAPGKPFDLIFLDPPYRQNLVRPAAAHLISGQHSSQKAVFVIETHKSEVIDLSDLNIEIQKTYGDTRVFIAKPVKNPYTNLHEIVSRTGFKR